MYFSGGRILLTHMFLLTHMLMSGSWRIYRPGEQWRGSRDPMRVMLATEKLVAVALRIQIDEFHTADSLQRRAGFTTLVRHCQRVDSMTTIRGTSLSVE